MTTLNLLSKKNTYLCALVFLFSLNIYSQDPATTSNDLITGVTVNSYFAEQVDPGAGKNNSHDHLIDGDVDTDWAAESTTGGELIFDLNGTFDLAEIQHLTVAKSDPYSFEVLVSTTGTANGDFTDVFGSKQESNLDATYKQLTFPSVATGVKYVKIKCYGRVDATTKASTSAWNTISELRFYAKAGTLSVENNELSQSLLYPIPANDKLYLKNFNNKVNKIEIFNLLGKKIISYNIESSIQTIDTSKLANGMYLVKLTDKNNASASKKLIIQH